MSFTFNGSGDLAVNPSIVSSPVQPEFTNIVYCVCTFSQKALIGSDPIDTDVV